MSASDGRVRTCSPQAAALLEQQVDDLVGTPVLDLCADGPQGRDKAELLFFRFTRGEAIDGEPLLMKRSDGSSLWVRLSVTPVFDDRGRVTESRSVVVDNSEQKGAENDLLTSQKVFETVAAGIVVQAANGSITYANRTAEEAFAIRASDLCGRTSADPDWQMVLEDGTAVPGHEHPSMVTLRTGEPLRNQVRGLFADRPDKMRWFLINTEPVFGDGDEPEQVIVTFTDITELKRAQQQLRESEQRVRNKLRTILSPEGDPGSLELRDIIDAPAVQSLMNHFNRLTGVGVGIIDLAGEVLVATGWQEICTEFHRKHPEMKAYCIESDIELSRGVAPGEFKMYKCKNCMWDIATPVVVGGRRVGNLFLGQFLFDDEQPDFETFRWQARTHGFDEGAYLAALDRVPRYSRERVDEIMRFYSELTQLLSSLGLANTRLAHLNAEKDVLVQRLQESEASLRKAQRLAHVGSWEYDVAADRITWSEEVFRLFGLDPAKGTPSWSEQRTLVDPRDWHRLDEMIARALREGESCNAYIQLVTPSGMRKEARIAGAVDTDDEGTVTRFSGTIQDVTELRLAQRQVEQSEQLYQALFEQAGEGIIVNDPKGRIIDFNRHAHEALGYDRQELFDLPVDDFDAQHTPDELQRIRDEIVDRGSYAYATRHRTKSGELRDVLVSSKRVTVHGRKLVLSVQRDVTEQKQADRMLRESESKYRGYVDNAPHGVFLANGRGVYLDVNPAACAITGYERHELVGMALIDLVIEPDRGIAAAHFERVVRTGRAIGQARFQTKSGLVRHWSVDAVKLSDDRLLGFATDITERLDREEQYARIIETTPDAFWILDSHGRFLEANSAAQTMLGYSRDEMLRMPVSDVDVWDGPEQMRARIREIKAHGAMRFESQHRRKDGSVIEVEVNTCHLPTGSGRFFAFVTDISGRKRAQKEREELEQQLHQSQRMEAVGRLAGGVAHDFNNLLTVISGYGELLLDGLHERDPMRQDVEDILAATRSASTLTAQLLAFSRRQVIDPKVLDVKRQLSLAQNMLKRLIGEDIDFTCSVASDVWKIRFDPGQLDQVLVNLAVNARDAMPAGGKLTIRASNEQLREAIKAETGPIPPGNYVLVDVGDTGCGIDGEDIRRIFEPFFTTKEKGKGTGLGLSTVYGILRQNGGFVSVQSAVGQGARFRIHIPRFEGAIVETNADDDERALHGSETILLVEDQDMVRSLAERALKRYGYQVLSVASGGDALLMGESHADSIDLVLTDVVMPKMSGVVLVERLQPVKPGFRVLYMSGYTDDAISRHRILDEGKPFLQKPFRPLELVRKVREVLDA
ncbi:MAG: PAS domain S-box protein [Myxococcota bacterium]